MPTFFLHSTGRAPARRPRGPITLKSSRGGRIALSAGGLALAGMLVQQAAAASATWSGAVDGNWATAGNWSATPVPGTGDVATFGVATGGNILISLGSGVVISGVTFLDAPGYVLGTGASGSQTLTLNHSGQILNGPSSTAAHTINAALVLGANANAATYFISNIDTSQRVILSGPVTGGTGGTAGAKILRITGSTTGAGDVVLNGNIGGGGGTLALTCNSTGKVLVNGTNTFTGPMTVSGGSAAVALINNSATAGPLGNSTAAVEMGGGPTSCKLIYTGPTASSSKRFSFNSNAGIEIEQAGTALTLSGILDGAGALLKDGPGTLILTGANTFTGAYVNAGVLRLSGTGTLGAAAGSLFISGTMELNGRSTTVSDLVMTAPGLLVNGSNTACTLTINSPVSAHGFADGRIRDTQGTSTGILSLVKSGTGNVTLRGDNTYSGTTTISAGYLRCTHPNALGSPLAGTTVTSGGTLSLATDMAEPVTISGVGAATEDGALVGFGTMKYSGLLTLGAAARVSVFPSSPNGPPFVLETSSPITGNFALTLAGTGDGEMNSIVSTASLIKDGTRKWTLLKANTYAGVTTISAGILNIQHGSALGTTAGNTSVVAGATLQLEGGITTLAEPITLRGIGDTRATGALQSVSGDNTWAGVVTLGADSTISCDADSLTLSQTANLTGAGFDLTLTGAGNGQINPVIATGAGLLIKSGSGRWRLPALNSYSGRTTVNEGFLEITTLKNVSGGTSSLGNPTTVANGTIYLGSADKAGGLRFTGATDAASNRVINLAGSTGGAVLDSSSSTNAKVVLTSAMTATGPGDKTLIITGSSTGANEITGAIVNSTGFKTSLMKTGPGSWTLSGINTYSGNTTVSGGSLTLTRAGLADTADVSLATGGTLTLGFAGSDAIARLYINGVQQAAGTWGSNASSATFKSPFFFGTGILNVSSGPPPGSFPVWIAGYGLSGLDAAFDADPDGDGLTNGMEWVFNSSPAESSFPSPLVVTESAGTTVITFPRADATEGSSTLVISRSTDLVTWTDLLIGAVSSVDAGSGISITVTENGAAADTVQITVNREDVRQFLRLKVTPSGS